MALAEDVDEQRDGVVGHYALEEIALVDPSHRVLVAGKLHPDAVHGVFGDDNRLSHHEWISATDTGLFAQRVDGQVVEWLTALQREAVHTKLEVVAHLVECGLFLPIVAGGEQQREQKNQMLWSHISAVMV